MRPARGVTLLELTIALAASVLVLAGALALLTSQQRLFQASAGERSLQETGRVALDDVAANLRLAGFGIDPALAFDFGPLAAVDMDRAPAGASVSAASLACARPVACRDSVTGSDELVFAMRNPSFVRSLAAAPTTGALALAGPLRQPLFAGQILQVMCFGGAQRWAYVTVASKVDATNAAQVTVPLAPGNGDQIPFQNGYLTDPCFGTVAARGAAPADFAAAAKAYKVDRYRYFVASYDGAGNVVANGTAGARPYLMLDQGLTTDAGDPMTSVIAPDVEDLQVAYVFPASPPALQLLGAAAGAAIASGPTGIDLAPAGGGPGFADGGTSPRRQTQHPANIRAVSVSVVARSPGFSLDVQDAAVPASGNRPQLAAPPGYRRQLFQTTTAVRNTDARAPYFPVYSTGPDGFNVGGG